MTREAPLVLICGIALATIVAITKYVIGCQRLVRSVRELHESITAIRGLEAFPFWGTVSVLASSLLVVAITAMLPHWLAARRAAILKRRVSEARELLSAAEKVRTFRLDPLPESGQQAFPPHFERADRCHEDIARWIDSRNDPFLYITGYSGSGKSSLMQAYVVPVLCNSQSPQGDAGKGNVASILRSFGDIDETLRSLLGRPGTVWMKAPELAKLSGRELLEKASKRLVGENRRLILVFDQFEEALIDSGEEPAHDAPILALVRSLSAQQLPNITCVFITRVEYGDGFSALGLPDRIENVNWKDVPPFSVSAGVKYMAKQLSKIRPTKQDVELLSVNLAKEAEALVDLPGRVTPIALNMVGMMYVEDPVLGRLLASSGASRGKELIPRYINSRVQSGELREAGPRVLEQLVTKVGFRMHPHTVEELCKRANIDRGVVETALLMLALRGVARRLADKWELSHDFLAPVVRRVLDDIRGSIWRRLRPWAPVAVAVIISLCITGLWALSQGRQKARLQQLNEDTRQFDEIATMFPDRHQLTIFGALTPGAARHLSELPGRWEVRWEGENLTDPGDRRACEPLRFDNIATIDCRREDVDFWLFTHTGPTSAFSSLEELRCSGSPAALACLGREDSGLRNLHLLSVDGAGVTDSVIDAFTHANCGLRDLRSLRVTDSQMTDFGLQYLARPGSGCASLTELSLGWNKQFTAKGLGCLGGTGTRFKTLKRLSINGPAMTDAALRSMLNRDGLLCNLTDLDFSNSPVTNSGFEWLFGPECVATSIERLSLVGTKIDNSGLKRLIDPNGLSKLKLVMLGPTQGTREITDAIRKARPSAVIGY